MRVCWNFFQILANLCFLFSLKIAGNKHEWFDLINCSNNFNFKVLISYDKKKTKPNKKFNVIRGKINHLYFTLDGSIYHNRRIAGNYHVDPQKYRNLLLKVQESNLWERNLNPITNILIVQMKANPWYHSTSTERKKKESIISGWT